MKTFEQCKKDHPNFTVGESLVGVVVDWSNAQCNGMRLAHGKVCKHHYPAKWQIAKQAFHLIAAAISKAKRQDQVYRLFRCLCGELKVSDIRTLVPGLQSNHVVDSGPNDWKSANHWVSWWTRLNPSIYYMYHLEMGLALSGNGGPSGAPTWMRALLRIIV